LSVKHLFPEGIVDARSPNAQPQLGSGGSAANV